MKSLRGLGIVFIALFTALPLASPAAAQDRSYTPPTGRLEPVVAKGGMVVAQERIAALIGADILKQGGNAIDAAVAAASRWP